MAVRLEITAGLKKGQATRYDRPEVVLIGRSPRCHLCVGDDMQCGRVHIIAEITPESCRIHDLGSTNGTFVNGQRVTDAALQPGDVLCIGQTEIQLQVDTPEAQPAVQAIPEPSAGAKPGAAVPVAVPEVGGAAFVAVEPEPDANAAQCARCGGTMTDVQAGTAALCPRCRDEMREIGEQLPGYHLLNQLSEGGMGVIWLAEETLTERTVAVKVMRPELAVTQRAGQLFLRESQVSLGLRHPHIVEFFRAGEYQGQLYIVMEYVDGFDADCLRERRGGRLPAQEVVAIALQALDALHYAHGQHIVHRDLKPSNLLLADGTAAYQVKIADFGLAKNFRDAGMSGITRHGEVRGSVPFMPPEQVLNSRGVDHRADLFGLGATLYTLLTGAFVFNFNPARKDPLLTIVEDEVTPIEQRGIALPADLCAAVNRAIRKDPAERFQTADEMQIVLRGVGV